MAKASSHSAAGTRIAVSLTGSTSQYWSKTGFVKSDVRAASEKREQEERRAWFFTKKNKKNERIERFLCKTRFSLH
jgi:hypothetical protein